MEAIHSWLGLCELFRAGVDDGEDADPFASGQRVTDLQDFANRFGLVSPAAVVHFAERFGSLRAHEQGMVFQMSDSEKQLLNTTLAVCVIRSNENRMTPDMGRALLKALNPTPPAEVRLCLVACALQDVQNPGCKRSEDVPAPHAGDGMVQGDWLRGDCCQAAPRRSSLLSPPAHVCQACQASL